MGKKFQPHKPVSLVLQKEELERKYPKLIEKIEVKLSQLTCIMWLKPSEHSERYKIRIEYKLRKRPKAWMIEPELQKFDGKKPHHIYGCDREGHPELCVYYPRYHEWDENRMFLADTFVPWIVTWLNTYEYWVLTGKWCYEESPRKVKPNER